MYVLSFKFIILTIQVQSYYHLNLMFSLINSPIITGIFSKRKFTLIYPFPSLSDYIFVSLVSYRYTLKVNALNIMGLYTFIIKAARELKFFNHRLNGQSLFYYNSIVLLTNIISTFTYIHRHFHDICLPLPRKVHYLYYIVCICYIFFLKLLIIVLFVCKLIYHSLHPSYINYGLYLHVSRSHAVCLCMAYSVSRFIVHLIYSTVTHRAIQINRSISITIYTYNVTLYAYGYRPKDNLNLIYYATQVFLPSGNICFIILCNGENVYNLFVYTNYELRGYVKNNLILTYPPNHIISKYYQFHLPTLSELFLKVYISINFDEFCPLLDYF